MLPFEKKLLMKKQIILWVIIHENQLTSPEVLIKLIGYKWNFKKKMKIDRTIDKFKARLVAKGFT